MAGPQTVVELGDLIERFFRGYFGLRDRFDDETAKALVEAARELSALDLQALHEAAEKIASRKPEDFKEQGKLRDAKEKIDKLGLKGLGGALEERDRVGLATFFHDVAEAYRAAQEELNIESLDYARNVPEGIPPAHFAIPSVRAEMEVGFETRRDRKVNLVFLGATNSRQDYGHSKISFEVVSAPPPPGGRLLGMPPFFVVGHERESPIEAVKALGSAAGIPSDFQIDTASVLVLRLRRSAYYSDETAYLLMAVEDTGKAVEQRRTIGAHVVRSKGRYSLTNAIFTPANLADGQVVFVPPTATLPTEEKALRRLEANLGDLLLTFSVSLYNWISEGGVRYPGFLAPADERLSVLNEVYQDARITSLTRLGGTGAYDLVLRRRDADG